MAKLSTVWNYLLTSLDTIITDHKQGHCLLSLDNKNKSTDNSVDPSLMNTVLIVQHSL